MNEFVLRQRQLVDEVVERLDEISRLNKKIEDENLLTDVLCLIGQHRHKFEEQLVADHSDCVTIQFITGTYNGNCGGLGFLAARDKFAKKMVLEIAERLKK